MLPRRPTGKPGPADVLVAGPDREPRRLPRWVALVAVAVLLLAVGARGGWELRQDRAEQARQAAMSADLVDLQGQVTGMLAGEGSGTATAQVTIESTGGPRPRGRVTGVQLVGPGLSPTDYPQPVISGLPAGVQPSATVDCARAARERLTEADVLITLLPASRTPRVQRLPVPSRQVREAVLAACGLPDRRAQLVVEASGSGDALALFVAGVPRSRAVLRLEDVTVPGYSLTPGKQLPVQLPGAGGSLLTFQLQVDRCDVVRPGGPVVVRLTEDGQPVTVVAGPSVQQPQPGAVPVEQLLDRLARRSC